MFEREILEIYKKCNIKKFPIDCNAIVQKLGFILASYSELANNPEEYRRLCLYSSDAFTLYGEKNMICYNNKIRHSRVRFSLMHEVGHYVLQTEDENAADIFAASILAPIPIARRNIIVTTDYVCKTFDVSVAMANRVVMACKGKKVYGKDEKALIKYFDSFDEGLRTYREEMRRSLKEVSTAKAGRPKEYPFDWNELMLIKHDMELYSYER